MASPQTANGYGRLANELAEALYRFPFSGQELRLVLWVLRSSYGWSRKRTDVVTVRSLAERVMIPTASVGWVLAGLTKRGVLFWHEDKALELNKNYEEWLRRAGSGQLALTITPLAAKGRRAAAGQLAVAPGRAAPTLEDVRAHARASASAVDPARFFHHFEAIGWRKSGKPITNWKSAFAYWERTEKPGARGAAATGKTCPLCETHPLPYPNASVCEACEPRCRACHRQTAQLRIVRRPDGTRTAVCRVDCSNSAPPPVVAAAVPRATRQQDQERSEKFLAERRRRSQTTKQGE